MDHFNRRQKEDRKNKRGQEKNDLLIRQVSTDYEIRDWTVRVKIFVLTDQ